MRIALLLLALAASPTPPAPAPQPTLLVRRPELPPPGAFGHQPVRFPFSRYLLSAGEVELDPAGPETYRFLWVRPVREPVVIRVWVEREATHLVVTILSVGGGGKPRKVLSTRALNVPAQAWAAWQKQLQAAQFWSLTAADQEDGTDGSEWFLEGARQGSYHAVYRWSPEHFGEQQAFADLCLALTDMAQLGIDRRDLN